MHTRLSGRAKTSIMLVFAVFILSNCTLFVTHYDATAYQYFTSLKAYHLKFLDDFTTGNDKLWDEKTVISSCESGDLRFREATEYAAGKNDKTRVRAIEYLHNVFKNECQLSMKMKKLFSDAYAVEQRSDVAQNYDLAIKGELSKVGAPSK